MTNYIEAIAHINSVLRIDTYDAAANYRSGIRYRAMKDTINAIESLGWAARDIKYRSVAYAQMAELYLASKNYQKANIYAQKTIDFNTYNLNARKVMVVSARKNGLRPQFEIALNALSEIAPLDYFALAEQNFMVDQNPSIAPTNEFPAESVLNLALQYEHLGLRNEAVKILDNSATATKNQIWSAYLLHKTDFAKSLDLLEKISNNPIHFVSPFRRETIPVLKWASEQFDTWKFTYYFAQNYIAVGQVQKRIIVARYFRQSTAFRCFFIGSRRKYTMLTKQSKQRWT